MAWTDSETVKTHLPDIERQTTTHYDIPVAVDASGDCLLPHRGLVESSEKVKVVAQLEPLSEDGVQLNGEVWRQLGYSDLVPDSVVVAADDTLQTIYLQDADYAVDPSGGRLRRIAGGAVSDGQNVQVYYRRYSVLTRDTDYTIDYAAGTISHTTNDALQPDTTVWVDYKLNFASGADALVEQAITEAEDAISALLKEGYGPSSDDQGLKTGATALAVAVVCRGLAARALTDGASAAEGRAKGWRELADAQERSARLVLRPFLKNPALTAAERRGNRSWEWE